MSGMWLKVLQWVLPIVFVAGGVYMGWAQNSADIERLRGKVERLREGSRAHELTGHVLTNQRLEILVQVVEELKEGQKRSARHLLAICVETGAVCRGVN